MNDIIFDNGDVQISNGDFVVSDSTAQETELIMYANLGQLPLNPLLGVNIQSMINGSANRMALTAIVRKNMKNDDLEVENLNIALTTNGTLSVDVNTKRKK